MDRKTIAIALLVGVVLILAISRIMEIDDLESNSSLNKAVVKDYKYFEYIDNEESNQKIRSHKVNFSYEYNGNIFSSTDELQPFEYESLFDKPLRVGDTIEIIHSTINPANSRIKR
ncbi:MAG: hypothetical protein ACFB15_16625 [Cyclobacteriaceae bacterium]